ncbi:hypothetical protein BU24DRAFT_45411 [Aaosphaeria arxii CBS 175.79]|uniref:Uncharacterized protein n=1 Tax=Aaosphaeria arxii CBS 175.79 TaxID=1450172 RepID=A0A6A5XCW0_9PLEO|nr:uncharacterized protein BU24DRAFT_45411 [Aaosphaeria arxii CBS 175.79]KAF2010760.1 hypothetical protein BU24DRAFT_45411 [Aaosphaeria arxii CBS 175.79]
MPPLRLPSTAPHPAATFLNRTRNYGVLFLLLSCTRTCVLLYLGNYSGQWTLDSGLWTVYQHSWPFTHLLHLPPFVPQISFNTPSESRPQPDTLAPPKHHPPHSPQPFSSTFHTTHPLVTNNLLFLRHRLKT